MARNPRFTPWTTDELSWLKMNYTKDYSELESYLGKTKRAIKHKVAEYKLVRDEKRPWTSEEDQIIKSNPGLSSRDFVERGLLKGRTEVAVMFKKNKLLGTARRIVCFSQTQDVAWLFGAIFSDGHINKTQLSFTQKQSDHIFLERVRDVLVDLGLKVTLQKKSGMEYSRLWCCSNQFNTLLGKVSWSPITILTRIDSDFAWVKQKPYVWSFLGGVLDGDGSVSVRDTGASTNYVQISFAMKDDVVKDWFIELIKSIGFDMHKTTSCIKLVGGELQARAFLNNIDVALVRKSAAALPVLDEGLQKIPYRFAKDIIAKHHYLGTLPVGVTCYGLVENKHIIGVAAVGQAMKTMALDGLRTLELKRFVLVENKPNLASSFLAKIIKELKLKNICDALISYADLDLHTGTIYRAVGFEEVSRTGESMIYVSTDGRKFSGRYAIECIKAAGYDPTQMRIELGAGKIKFVKYLNR